MRSPSPAGLYIHSLHDLFGVREVAHALPDLAKHAGTPDLRTATERYAGLTDPQAGLISALLGRDAMFPERPCPSVSPVIEDAAQVLDAAAIP